MMYAIPRSLRGASLGTAHAWVREQMAYSNPRPTMGDYTLRDSSGKRVSLSALVKGELNEVDIVGAEELDAARANPSHPMSLKATTVPAAMYQQNLPRIFGGVVTPALWARAKDEYGLFGATQRLSILLSRPSPLEGHNNYSPRTLALLDARLGTSAQPMHRFVRSNPGPDEVRNAQRGIGLGPVNRASNIMARTNMLGAESTKNIEAVRSLVDSYLDTAEVDMNNDEQGALLSMAGQMSMQFENSKGLFDNFAKNVLAPYLISSTANFYAIEYINEYIMPATRLIIENTGGSNKDAMLRKLDSYYRHMVKSLATSPADFYAGKEMALVAHPAFLFKRAGLVLLPVPKNRKDRSFYTMSQVGQPLEYTDSGFVAQADMPKAMKPIVRTIGRGELKQMRERKTTYNPSNLAMATYLTKQTLDTIYRAVDSLRARVELSGPEDTSAYNLLLSETRRMGQKKLEDLHKDIAGMPAFFYMDLPGIRPIPTNWPQQLVYAMMETLSSYRDRLTGLNKDFDGADFLQPSGIHLDLAETKVDDVYSNLDFAIRTYEADDSEENAVAVIKAGRALNNAYPGELPDGINERRQLTNSGDTQTKKGKATIISNEWPQWQVNLQGIATQSAVEVATRDYGEAPSIYKIVLEMVNRSITYYNYEPTRDETWFTITLMYYCLRHMSLDTEVGNTSFFGGLTELMSNARKEELNEWLDRVKQYGEAPAGDLGDEALSKYIALKYAREALDDPGSDAYMALFGLEGPVRTNPGPSFNTAEMNRVKQSLDATIAEYEKALNEKYKDGTAQKSYDYLKQYFAPALSELVREGEAVATFVGDEILDRETTADQYMDQLYTKVYQHLDSAWKSADKVVKAVAAENMEDLYNATTTLHNSLENAQLLTDQHTSIGGFSSLLGSDADYQMQVKADQLSGTFRLIAQDLEKMGYSGAKEARFKREADSILKLGDLTNNNNYRYPGPLLSAVIGFLVESKDLAEAYNPAKPLNSIASLYSSVRGGLRYHIRSGPPRFDEAKKDLSTLVFSDGYSNKMSKPDMDNLARQITVESELSTVASVLKSAGYVSKGDVLEKVTKPLQARLEKKLKKLADESLKVSVQERLSGAGALIKDVTVTAGKAAGQATKYAITGAGAAVGAGIGGALTAGGALAGAGYTAVGTLAGAGLTAGGAAIGAGLTAGGAAIGAGLTAGGAAIGAGATVGSALISGGITAAGLVGSLGISSVVSTYAYYRSRQELREEAMRDPAVVDALAAKMEAKAREAEADMVAAATAREERAARLQMNAAQMAAQRARFALAEARALTAAETEAEKQAALQYATARSEELDARARKQAQEIEAEIALIRFKAEEEAEREVIETRELKKLRQAIVREKEAEARLASARAFLDEQAAERVRKRQARPPPR